MTLLDIPVDLEADFDLEAALTPTGTGPAGPRRWTVALDAPDARTPGDARRWVRERLEQARVHPTVIDKVVLAVSELVTNGWRHAGTALWITLYVDELHAVVGVGDYKPAAEIRCARAPHEGDSGHGLELIHGLGRLYVDRHREGTKCVVAVFDTLHTDHDSRN